MKSNPVTPSPRHPVTPSPVTLSPCHPVTLSSSGFADEMPQFGDDYIVHCEGNCPAGAGHGEKDFAAEEAGGGTAEDGCGADLLVAEHSEQLAIPWEGFVD